MDGPEPTGANPNLAEQVMSNAASTVTLENPMTQPEDHSADPASLLAAQSIQSIAETYVIDANDTLAAEGVPPVVIYDSVERLVLESAAEARGETSIMETSNTCTLPYQGTMTSRSGSPTEAEALQIFEKEINDDFAGEADSLSSDEVSPLCSFLLNIELLHLLPISIMDFGYLHRFLIGYN